MSFGRQSALEWSRETGLDDGVRSKGLEGEDDSLHLLHPLVPLAPREVPHLLGIHLPREDQGDWVLGTDGQVIAQPLHAIRSDHLGILGACSHAITCSRITRKGEREGGEKQGQSCGSACLAVVAVSAAGDEGRRGDSLAYSLKKAAHLR